ncbi:MAG: hypothetical protein JXK95_16740 [Bacteroidales bacterium]|nr:hypothetical protein [Bacteroidales bacterium]
MSCLCINIKKNYGTMHDYVICAGLILLSLLSSCDKNEQDIYKQKEIPLLSQVYFDTVLYYEYTYNDANLIVEEKSKLHYTRHHYNDKYQLTSSDYYVDPHMYSSCIHLADSAFNRKEWVNPDNTERSNCRQYFYNDKGQMIKSSDELTLTEFSYDNNNRICCQVFYHEGKPSGRIDYDFDDKGNVVMRRHYYILASGVTEPATTTEYIYDSKHNPYQTFRSLMTPGQNTNQNNIIKEIYTLHFEVDETIDKVRITENYYEYNEKGYPVRKNGTVNYIYK